MRIEIEIIPESGDINTIFVRREDFEAKDDPVLLQFKKRDGELRYERLITETEAEELVAALSYAFSWSIKND